MRRAYNAGKSDNGEAYDKVALEDIGPPEHCAGHFEKEH